MAPTVWGTTPDDRFDVISLTPEYIAGALEVMRYYFNNNKTCKAVLIPEQPGALAEMEEFTMRIAKDGLSVIAVERATNKVGAVAFNKLRAKDDPEEKVFVENYKLSCQHSASRNFLEVMLYANAKCDLFNMHEVDCMLEMVFIAILPEYRNREVTCTLGKASMDLAEKLLAGENVKQSIDGSVLSLEPVPKMITATFSSFITLVIGSRWSWETVEGFGLSNFLIDGKQLGRTARYSIQCKVLGESNEHDSSNSSS